jgi:predicted acylesterase/phospholipase RssA
MLLTGDRDLDVRQVLRSASYPVAFETQEGYSDGGVRDVTPLGLAIQWGATDIDAIVCARSGVPIWDTKDRGLLATAERILSIILDEVVVNDLAVCREHNQRILEGRGDSGKRLVNLNVWMPQNPLGYGSLDFDGPKLLEAFNQGRTDVHCKKLSYLRRATVAAVPKACSSYRPWGIKSDEEGRSIDPSDCYVCGMGPKAHQG